MSSSVPYKSRVIGMLRKLYPAECPWVFDGVIDAWRCRSGWCVRKHIFVGGEHVEYRRSDTNEVVRLFPPEER